MFQIKSDTLAELSKLVQRVGGQQKDLVQEISQQLGQHNEMMEKALDKQQRMDAKIAAIEDQLLQKKGLGYQRKLEKLELSKKEEGKRLNRVKNFAEDREEDKAR